MKYEKAEIQIIKFDTENTMLDTSNGTGLDTKVFNADNLDREE